MAVDANPLPNSTHREQTPSSKARHLNQTMLERGNRGQRDPSFLRPRGGTTGCQDPETRAPRQHVDSADRNSGEDIGETRFRERQGGRRSDPQGSEDGRRGGVPDGVRDAADEDIVDEVVSDGRRAENQEAIEAIDGGEGREFRNGLRRRGREVRSRMETSRCHRKIPRRNFINTIIKEQGRSPSQEGKKKKKGEMLNSSLKYCWWATKLVG
ncbi:hypothetical protein L484_021551 [Morus notabilis]|uniref:Uncharacterized protein n=1 Tax=Morus notabilis TaxID=981085 RepID=W9SH64_9ROSA|nr:hypothetical protein L484_021551 [Morus notabilis]